jgi:hypothetical protein
MVWCAIWRHGNGSDEGCWASVDRLAKVSRIGKRDRTRDAIRWLKENGWLIAEERPGFTTRYLATLEGGVNGSDGALPLGSQPQGTPSGHQDPFLSPRKGYPFLDTRKANKIPLNKIPTAFRLPVFLTKYLQTKLQTSFAAVFPMVSA